MNEFAKQVITWQQQHGRHDLPWQYNQTAYRVWISEIMLQQTQVNTVIPYFKRFMRELPSLKQCAAAPVDQVLRLWSGLGYYSRARNIHACANTVISEYNGRMPSTVEQLSQLPGIGRSTAGAIASFARGQPSAILDGNVKRVLMRSHAIPGWYGQSAVLKQLWQLSESLTPNTETATYNQGLMDLGAMICTRRNPSCNLCPLADGCQANLQNRQHEFPAPKPKKARPTQSRHFVLICHPELGLLLQRRPNNGIWGGLWSLPECELDTNINQHAETQWQCTVSNIHFRPRMSHQFSHYQLNLHPITCTTLTTNVALSPYVWYKRGDNLPGGIAAPIQTLIKEYCHEPHRVLQTIE